MLRLPLSIALFLGLGAFAAEAANPASPPSGTIDVTMDHAKIARIPAGVATLVIGNPIVADVTMLKGSGVLIVTGKGFGETNLLMLDAQGNVLDEEVVRVAPAHDVLVVQRGTVRESFSCNPFCVPSVQIGDDQKSFDSNAGQISAHNGLAQNGASGSSAAH
jgi:hypothetical protein